MSEQKEQDAPKAGMWAIVEIFGHQRIAGFMSEQTIGGHGFIRVDVPEVPGRAGEGTIAAHSKLYGPGAIYAINPVDEALATVAAHSIRHAPVESYGLSSALRNMSDEHRKRLLAPPDDGDGDPDSEF